MDLGIAVDLAGRGLEDPRVQSLGEPEHVDRAHHRGLDRLDRVVLVVTRCGRAGEVVDLVDLDLVRIDHVVADELEVRATDEMLDVGFLTREEVVEADHLVALLDQTVAEMGAEKAGTAGDEDPLEHRIWFQRRSGPPGRIASAGR